MVLESVLEEQQVLGSEWTVLFRREQRTLAARIDVGEHSFSGIPGVEACSVWDFNKQKLRTVFHGECPPEEVSFS